MYRSLTALLVPAWVFFGVALASGQTLTSSSGPLKVEPVVEDLDTPWALGFLPGGGLLITEREGELLLVRNGDRRKIKGLPAVVAEGQGGLLDVMVPRDFVQSREIFLTFSKRQGRGAGTAVASAQLDLRGARLTGVKVIFEAAPSSLTGRHFGSRIVEAADGTLMVTIGDRGQRPSAQNLRLQQGSVIRINRDGSVPQDNPLVSQPEAQPEIWSWGHRNPQGLAVAGDGSVWAVEHGAKGGDEINRIRRGVNYGWPVISYGRHYSGGKIGEGTHKEGLQQPDFYWDPSIAPSGMMIYSGKLWPNWRGHIFVGSLKFDYIARLSGAPLAELEQLRSEETNRVRDVREGPDGAIWFISVGNGAVYRVTPGS